MLDYYRDFQVSSAIPAVAMLSLTGAPALTFPANRSEVDIDATPVLRFSWMAVFSAIPDALISYRFRIWQVRPDNRDPYEIVRVTSPLYEATGSGTALLYDGSMPPLTRGSRYVWQVTAIDGAGKVLFKNNGDSDIFTLRYGKQCAAPSAVITKVTHNSVSVSWNSNPSVREYTVRYKKENATGWQQAATTSPGITIEGLDHSALYELTVTGNCGVETSDNERLLRFKTDRFVDYSCGAAAPGISLENREPLPALHRFDEFMAADFYVEVTEVSGSNGVFSGRGLASVPYLNFIQFEVKFNNITINTDRQMIDGHVVFLYDEATGMIIGGDMGFGGSQTDDEPGDFSFEEALDHIADQTVTLNEEATSVTVNNGQVTVVTESGQTKNYLVGQNQTLAIVSPEGIVIVDQASGQVFQAPTSSPGSASNVRTPSQSKIHGCLVSFSPLATQRFGFDAVGNGIVKPNNYFLRDRNGDAIPWKSLEVGNTDRVAMLSNGDCQSDSLRFIRESGILTPTSPGRNNSLELLLTGGFEGQEERLTVARASRQHINDSTTQEILTEAGVLGLVTYKRITQNVVLVPVNSSSFPSPGIERSVIIKRLNEIYGPGLVNWNVHVDNAIEVGKLDEADFKVEGTSLLSKYTTDMNRVIRAYKRDRVTDDNTMYLFFMEIPNLGSHRKGFMPLSGNYGFIFNFEAKDLELIAHELAHGAFNLRHTFSDKAQHYFPQNQTANLMDYAGGTELWKYQWDLIHNPESILFAWAQEESEGTYSLPCLGWFDDCDDVLKILETFRNARIKGNQVKINGQTKTEERILIANSIKVGDTDYKRVRLIYKPKTEDHTFNPTKYSFYDQQFFVTDGSVDWQRGFVYYKDGEELFKILVDDESAKIGKLKEYLFGDISENEEQKDDEIDIEQIIEDTKTATQVASKYTSGTACNICVRSALYIIKNDSVLFPETGSGYNDPNNGYVSREIQGYITPDGRAIYIKSDFDNLSNKTKLNERFVEISKTETEDWAAYFQRLQNDADKGIIIIGVMLNSSGTVGHVMMITPGGLIEINEQEQAWGRSFVSQGINNVPRVLECGDTDRENEAPLCRNVDRRGAQERLKWYKYTK
ncbi:MAG TPA: fibronectin type III domain-containing protein [Peptococcaceae bacterium]|nr:fibronectin type III domain-containing protein [Peptococcaceae bacterium]